MHVIGDTLSGSSRAFIIDFGKACKFAEGKGYNITEEQKKVYKWDHRQIVPDLRDGLVKQSVPTDIYSFGRVIKKVNKVVLHFEHLGECFEKTSSYHGDDRPTLSKVTIVLTIFSNNIWSLGHTAPWYRCPPTSSCIECISISIILGWKQIFFCIIS